ncbi:peptidase U32 family protein [uncultured Flavonifractor sp.]|uniref:peptidase U32 family protein n=1 Tax=uncultured Flavonifractor sp. TaxID=1193534 RepID=UPI0026084B0F|nr:U32 family peptidase [uncultured Flavonifractor sp.]
MDKKIELLSPAGDMERLKMSLAYGADAVYLAGSDFGMRAFAGNFTPDEMKQAVELCHSKGVSIHVTCNTMPRNDEVARLPEWLEYLQDLGVDAAIVADVGVLSLLKKHASRVKAHISTQASISNYQAARAWYELGASRVILARELSLDEIREIRAKAPKELEIEAFVHGAMCVSYSGRCLLSNYMTGRDANRGACAQPCRYKYALVEEKRPGEYFPIGEDEGGAFIMNSRDMCMIDHIPKLMEAGLDSLKIEGRAKSAYYAAVVTAAYRHAIDAAAAGQPLDPVWRAEIDKVSHRPYSTGFYFGQPGQYTGDARYIREWQVVAIVTACDSSGMATLSLRNKFAVGDPLELVGPDVAATPFTAPTMEDENGWPLTEPRTPQMVFRMQLPRPVPPLSIIRACRENS